MTKRTTVLAAAAVVAAVTIIGAHAFAQGGPGMGHGRMGAGMGHDMKGGAYGGRTADAGDPAARLGAIKSEIGIRTEQASAWDAYAKVLTEVGDERRGHRESIDRDAVRKMEPKERQAFRESMQTQRDATITKVRAAAEALLTQLDDAQKEKARRTLPGLVASGAGEGMRHGMMGGHGQDPGQDPGQGPRMGRGPGQHNNR